MAWSFFNIQIYLLKSCCEVINSFQHDINIVLTRLFYLLSDQ